MKSQDYIHKFMEEVYSFFKHRGSDEPITIQDLTYISVPGEGCPDDNIDEWIDENGETPLHYAVRFYESASLQHLLYEEDANGNKFNILQKNKQGKTAMRLAFEDGNIEAIAFLTMHYKWWFRRKLLDAIKPFARRTVKQ